MALDGEITSKPPTSFKLFRANFLNKIDELKTALLYTDFVCKNANMKTVNIKSFI